MITRVNEEPGATGGLQRSGPVGRLVRLVMGVFMAWTAYEWIEAGLTWFSEPTTTTNPWVWIWTGLTVYYGLYQLPTSALGRRWGMRILTIFGGVLVVTMAVTFALEGRLWASPLTSFLYGLIVVFAILVSISFVVSLFLGTRGCEIGALGELIRRFRGSDESDDAEVWCIAGLHKLDEWEAGRRH